MSKRKYMKGAPVTSLDELYQQPFVYMNSDKTVQQKGWFQNWPLRVAHGYIDRKMLFKPIPMKGAIANAEQ